MHLPSSVLHTLSCKSGASHGVLYMPTTCASHGVIRSIQGNQVYCRGNHVHQEPDLDVCLSSKDMTRKHRFLVDKGTAQRCLVEDTPCRDCVLTKRVRLLAEYVSCRNKQNLSSNSWLNISPAKINKTSCTSEASLGCTVFAIKCNAEAIV